MFFYYRSMSAVVSFVRANIAGFARGLEHRQPVSRRVSQLYKKHAVDFANPLLLLTKRPGRARFCAERPQYYPSERAALQVGAEH
jgi:hypothetical protein